MSASHDGGSSRRKSLAFFSRPSILQDPESNPWPAGDVTMNVRPKSAFFSTGSGCHEISAIVSSEVQSRSRVLMKAPAQRPRSVFGALMSQEQKISLLDSSGSSSIESWRSEGMRIDPSSRVVVHSGEVVSTGGLLRKKKEFMVLTYGELLRYKSESKASEALAVPAKPPTTGRAPSTGSIGDMATEHTLVTMMNRVVAVYRSGFDMELGTSVQVDHLDDVNGTPSSTVLHVATPREAEKWLDILRKVSRYSRSITPPPPVSNSAVDYIARRLEAEKDYSPAHFQIFRVVQRSGKPHNRSGSSDDLQKMYSTICYLAIGIHKVHLVPIPKASANKGATIWTTTTPSSYGIVNLCGLALSDFDDSFVLTFRSPCCQPQKVLLASTDGSQIIQAIRQASSYLRPQWLTPPYKVAIPQNLKDQALQETPHTPGDDFNGFDRTLAAHCTAYDLDASYIVYGIHTEVEDGPQFVLYPPAHPRRRQYTDLELLAVMRALRWNESFGSISFRGISLEPLKRVYDSYGKEYEPHYDRAGRPLDLKTSERESLLIHELRALALYSGKLRRMDFYECIKQNVRQVEDAAGNGVANESGCGIVDAIMPLCRRGLTNVDWLILTGIELVESDLDWLVDAAASKLAHFRGFEVARCGLTERMMTLFLNALTTHENTLESLDLCGNPARIHVPTFNNTMCYFPFLRKLNLSRLLRSSGDDAILTAETLLRWRLQELDLSEVKLNDGTVDAIATYLASPQSESLRHLTLTQCGLTSHDIALFMHSMSKGPGKPRDMHLYVGQNPLAQHHDQLVACIATGTTPTHLTMRMVDYPKEDTFRELVKAMTFNKTIRYLDISKVSLPYEAGHETCAVLGEMFAKNNTLKELDISGEQAVLESASLGMGLVDSLAHLAENKSLEVLRIGLQSLGTPGAMELASVLTKNTTLRELHCEMNDIHLQGYTAMIDAVEHNQSLLYLPRMDGDRAEHVKCLKDKLFHPTGIPGASKGSKCKSKRKDSKGSKKHRKVAFIIEPIEATGAENKLLLLEEKWESEAQRLQRLLARNWKTFQEKYTDRDLQAR